MTRHLLGAALFLSLALTGISTVQAAETKPTLLNGTAATVGKQLVTVLDARFYRALTRFCDGDKDVFKSEEGEELRRTVQKIVLEEMVVVEMKSFSFEGGSKSEAESQIRLQRQKSREREGVWRDLLSRFGKSESAAVERRHKSLQVERFIQKKVETLTPIVTEAEAERYFKQNESRFFGNNFERLKPSIILLLKKERMQKGLEEWVRFLKDKYGVTNLLEG